MDTRSRLPAWLDRCEHWLDTVGVRLVLSLLILTSLLPSLILRDLGSWPEALFLTVFASEFALRAALSVRRARRRRLRASELLVLCLDFLALLSFLPLTHAHPWLRHLRLARLLLLLGYWSGLLSELWSVLNQRERRGQILIVLVLGGVLAFGSAAILLDLGVRHDFDQDGKVISATEASSTEVGSTEDGSTVDSDHSFLTVLWWSLLQIEDAGNLVKTVDHHPLIIGLSTLLTLAGLLLLSFFIGIGTNVVAELMHRARARPVGLTDHTVILGLTPYTSLLLHGLADIYRKNLRPYRGAVMAAAEDYEDLAAPELRHFQYRQGDPARLSDLERVNLRQAKRVILLASNAGSETAEPDADILAAILAVRQSHPDVPLYPDMEHERNFPAALAAGGTNTHLVGSGSMLGYYVAQNVAYPDVFHLYRQLLRSEGAEIYTYLYTPDEIAQLTARPGRTLDTVDLHTRARRRHRTTLLGLFVAEPVGLLLNPVARGRSSQPRCKPFDDQGRLPASQLRGVIGISLAFRHLQELAEELLREPTGVDASPSTTFDEPHPEPSRAKGPSGGALSLHPDRRYPECVLILGAGPRVPRVIRELIGFFPSLQITVLADDRTDLEPLAHDVFTKLSRGNAGTELTRRDETFHITHPGNPSSPNATVTLLAADWTHDHRLRRHGAVTLEAADAILLLPAASHAGGDSDGRIALDALHLADLERTGSVRFRPGTHVLALVRDPDKGDLLESRLEAVTRDSRLCRYTVISSERARHRFVMQNVFVHGLNSVYLQLLDSQGEHFARLLPQTADGAKPTGSFDAGKLADELLLERGWLLIGFELCASEDGGEVEVELDPARLLVGSVLRWERVRALYVMVD